WDAPRPGRNPWPPTSWSARRRWSDGLERRPMPQSLAQPLRRVLRQPVEQSVIGGQREHSSRGLGRFTDLLAAWFACGWADDRAVLVAEPERPTIHAAVLMLHASEPTTTAWICALFARRGSGATSLTPPGLTAGAGARQR